RCEYRRNRPGAIEVLRRGTLAYGHALEAADLWPLSGCGKIGTVLPRRPPIRAHDDARLVVVDDERLDARAICVRSGVSDRAASGDVSGRRCNGTRGPDGSGRDKCSNRASTHRHNSSSSKWIWSI